MLEINLHPESRHKESLSALERFHIDELHRTPLLWIMVALMVLGAGTFAIPIHLHQQQLRVLNTKIQALLPKKAELDQLERAVQELKAQETAFRGVGKASGIWAKRLNTLSNVTPEGVWFTDLTLDETKGLVLQGSVIGEGGNEMVRVGRLVADLKADPEFTAAIKNIQIESIKRIQDKEVEIVQFTLTCPPTQVRKP